jgi:hypothetical protein
LREFNELDVEDTDVDVEESPSFDIRLFELRPRTGEDIAFMFMGSPE